MFTHISREDMENCLHISHLYHYVSAYYESEEEYKDLIEMIEEGLKEAKEKKTGVYVDKDGECQIRCNPNSTITLMLPWKHYKIIREE